jgi:hypothetical protein
VLQVACEQTFVQVPCEQVTCEHWFWLQVPVAAQVLEVQVLVVTRRVEQSKLQVPPDGT